MKTQWLTHLLVLVLCTASPAANAAGHGRGGGTPSPTPPPTYPPARFWHAITSNEDAQASKLFMFGGTAGAPTYGTLNDLWIYTGAGSTGAAWTLAATGSTKPPGLEHVAWACSTLSCLASNGNTGAGMVTATWRYDLGAKLWTSTNCKRFVCPSARAMATMAYDRDRDVFVLFGGRYRTTSLGDTYTFDRETFRWTARGSSLGASARRSAAMTFVPGNVNRVVMYGGQVQGISTLSDMYTWDGSLWRPVTQSGGPAVHSHDIAWDGDRNRLVLTGGFVDVNDTRNTEVWYFTFTSATSGTWTRGTALACQASLSSDPVVHRSARSARDIGTGTLVFFGGTTDPLGSSTAVDNTVECR